MQDYDWNDLKVLLALHRHGTLAEAARQLRVNETTVARRLKRLEGALQLTLFRKTEVGRYVFTDAAEGILAHAERVERETLHLATRLSQSTAQVAGTVRISSVPFLINSVLIPATPTLISQHPEVAVELVPEPRNIDLTKREADLAVRFSRPAQGGLAVKARKIATLHFDLYVARAHALDDPSALPWIGYAEDVASLPQARWTSALRARAKGLESNTKVSDLTSALAAAAAGSGIAILPCRVAEADNRLCKCTLPFQRPTMERDLWVLTHVDQIDRPAIRAAHDWVQSVFA